MDDVILKSHEQFSWDPEIENSDKLKKFKNIILCGMGGSHLSAGLIKTRKPGVNIYVHRDYGLPPFEDDFLKDSLLVACSYSGNTEETVSFLSKSISRGYNTLVITTGGKLLEMAEIDSLPIIRIPKTNIQPRQALGFMTLSLIKAMGDDGLYHELKTLKDEIDPRKSEKMGGEISKKLIGKIPVIYSSLRNLSLAYNWKIKFNESSKVPAFYNVFPELNHNEMNGFDANTTGFSKNFDNFYFFFLRDADDDPKIKKRMELTKKMFESRGYKAEYVNIEGGDTFKKIFENLILADWISFGLARENGVSPEEVPMIEEFKKNLN